MHEKLQEAGVPSKLLRIEGGGHGYRFSGATDLPDLSTIYVEWMDQHLRRVVMIAANPSSLSEAPLNR